MFITIIEYYDFPLLPCSENVNKLLLINAPIEGSKSMPSIASEFTLFHLPPLNVFLLAPVIPDGPLGDNWWVHNVAKHAYLDALH